MKKIEMLKKFVKFCHNAFGFSKDEDNMMYNDLLEIYFSSKEDFKIRIDDLVEQMPAEMVYTDEFEKCVNALKEM